jgi:hypothetical protein
MHYSYYQAPPPHTSPLRRSQSDCAALLLLGAVLTSAHASSAHGGVRKFHPGCHSSGQTESNDQLVRILERSTKWANVQSDIAIIICAPVRMFVNYDPAEQGRGAVWYLVLLRRRKIVKQKRFVDIHCNFRPKFVADVNGFFWNSARGALCKCFVTSMQRASHTELAKCRSEMCFEQNLCRKQHTDFISSILFRKSPGFLYH